MCLLGMIFPAVTLACPSCKQAIEGESASLGFYWSTLFLLGMPFAAFASFGGWIAYHQRRGNVADVLSGETGDRPGCEKEDG